MKNPIQIFDQLVPDILSGKKRVIISTIENPSVDFTDMEKRKFMAVPKRLVRACYYVSDFKNKYSSRMCGFVFKKDIFDTLKKEKNDPDLKYEIVGDFNEDAYFINNSSIHTCRNFLSKTKEFLSHKFIDTIVVVDKNYQNPKILYDKTGYLHIADDFRMKTKEQKRKRLLAEISGDPRALKEQGIFDIDNQTEKPLSPEPPVNEFTRLKIFDFGKKCGPSNTKLYNKIKKEVRRKSKVWPSAYASGQLVKEYKKRGGRYNCSRKGKTLNMSISKLSFGKRKQPNNLKELNKNIHFLSK